MTGDVRRDPSRGASRATRVRAMAAGLVVLMGTSLLGASWVVAQERPLLLAQADGSTSWTSLAPGQRAALAPLEREWNGLSPVQRQKWLDIAQRYPRMSEGDRARLQERMAAWSRLSPQQRGEARLRFQQARKLSPEERQTRWQQYQALPPEQRRELAEGARSAEAPKSSRERKAAAPGTAPKTNVVPNPLYAPPLTTEAPAVVRARPGVTTNLISQPQPPLSHQQTGLPKITATPSFVDRQTLLPKRGPQGAVVRPPPESGSKP